MSEHRILVVAIGRPTFDLVDGAAHVTAAVSLLERTVDQPLTVLRPEDGEAVFTDRDALAAALDRDARHEETGQTESGQTVPGQTGPGQTEPGQTEGAPVGVVVVLQATFSDSSLVASIAERVAAPLVVWSFPEERTGGRLRLNSLCGANLAAYLLRRPPHLRRQASFLHLDPLCAAEQCDGQTIEQAADRLSEALLRATATPPAGPAAPGGPAAGPAGDRPTGGRSEIGRRLATMFAGDRIGVIGDPPDGFEPCQGDPDALEELTGIEVERVPLPVLFDRADAVDEPTRMATEVRVRSTLEVSRDVENAGMAESIALYGGLRALATEHGWTALTTRCWPECMTEYGGAACTPMAMLTENGLPSVCEADMFGAATGLLLHHVAGSEPFIADLVDADTSDDTSVVWHCGVAPSTLARSAEPVTAITHPNRHRALANQFGLRPGRVTVARLSQAGGCLQLVIGGGEILDRPRPFQGTCGVLEWDEPVQDVLQTVFTVGLEHHMGLVYGDHRPALAALADEWDLPIVWLGHDETGHTAGRDADQRSGVTV